jgi:hypothetical protein
MYIHIQQRGTSPDAHEPVEPHLVAVIDGTEVPIAGYAIEPAESGPGVNLVLLPDSVTIGLPPTPPVKVPEKTAEPVRVWGSTGRDPREGLPGWTPRLAEQVAQNAAAVAQ